MVSKDSPTVDVEEAVEEAKGLFKRLVTELTKSSNTKQVAIGGISGWCTGYLAMKVGKSAAAALGGTIFVIQIAQYKGYININWSKVNKDLEKASEKLGGPSSNKLDKTFDKAVDFLDEKTSKAKDLVSKKKTSAKRWFQRNVVGEEPITKQHVFAVAFLGGVLGGTLTGAIF